MNPPVAARASQPSTPSLRDRLKDASLLREQCYIDGAWVGTASRAVTNPVNGVELAKIPLGWMFLTKMVVIFEVARAR